MTWWQPRLRPRLRTSQTRLAKRPGPLPGSRTRTRLRSVYKDTHVRAGC
jgi:hypothetical protein